MAFIQCDFYSDVLQISTSMNVILPQGTRTQIGMEGRANMDKHPVLYLLHGLSDDHTIWHRRTSIERYVSELGLAVVMPAVNRSFYADMAHGPKYWTFISEELPQLARSFFPLSSEREYNYVAGLSMGGYGAFKLALRCPQQFAAAASLSGAMDISVMYSLSADEYGKIVGDPNEVRGSENDLFYLAETIAASDAPKPMLYQCCGTEDFLYEDNVRFLKHTQQLGLPVTYEEEPGTHEWGYWDRKIQNVLRWLPLPEK
jgi:S-formylglutathione hydrolase FrmB